MNTASQRPATILPRPKRDKQDRERAYELGQLRKLNHALGRFHLLTLQVTGLERACNLETLSLSESIDRQIRARIRR